MRDVATMAGVGIATVSRVVNGKPVTPDLAERVTRAAELLGYRHDLTASSLRRADRRTHTLGLVLEDAANPFSAALHRAVEDAAADRGVLVLAGSTDEDPVREHGLLKTFTARRVDGLIAVPTGQNDTDLDMARQGGTPVVCVDRPTTAQQVDTVTVDNRAGVRAAVKRLHEAGHRRIAFLGDLRSIWTAEERYAGFVEGLAEAGCVLHPSLVRRGLHGPEAAQQATRALLALAHAPTALLSGQNLLTIGARMTLQELQLQHRVALIGFDDLPLADLLEPGISVIAQDHAAIGREAATLLFDRLEGEAGPARHCVLPTHYLPRGSGELPAPQDG
ncbi:LacI family DNA-binding transcriptional regulator [Streptomyces sp. Li-HN-5-11]|uniref:LacI family DNA-binding transcriptional regulator n=1 Tax=Streptomyces sp. Li-HN-5-11 TaxID=3075432 RepID=UPI0028B0DA61|nr:LacI family DNA-binding transcriptional regulator [Streptomyces sp. Li-HN-5-11]WNM32759.1 LacI family DNA-binding transcriptional regulator [Streptomyces sp. Li-HN-5-11]